MSLNTVIELIPSFMMMFANGPEDLGSITDRVIWKTE